MSHGHAWSRSVLAAALAAGVVRGAAGAGGPGELLTGFGSVRWGEGDPTRLAIKQAPEPGSLVRIWRELEVRGRTGATTLPVGAFVRVAETEKERVRVIRSSTAGDMTGWVSISDMPVRGDEPIAIDGTHLQLQRWNAGQATVAARWDDRFDWSGIEPTFVRVYGGERPMDGGRAAARLYFCGGGLAQVEQTCTFEGSSSQQHEAIRRFLDGIQGTLGKPRCRVLSRTTVVCTWEGPTGVMHLPLEGELREAPASDFPEGPRRSDLTGSTLWTVESVTDLGAKIESGVGEALAARRGRFLLVRYTIVNAGDTTRPFVYGGGIPHPTLVEPGGSVFAPVGKNSYTAHEAYVLAYADSGAARTLNHLVSPLVPKQSISFSAIFEVPSEIAEVALAVAESTAARSARTRIPLDDIEPAAAPVEDAQGRDLWEVLDRNGPLQVGTLCAATAAFPQVRQKLIDRVREVRAVESELDLE